MANEYLKRTPTSTGNRKVFTWSVWIKRNKLGTNQNLLCSTAPAIISKLLFDVNDKLQYQNNSPSFNLITNQSFRDVGSWIHILLVVDTTNATESNRVKLYANGERITNFSTETYPTINSQLIWNQTIGHWISNESSNVNYFDGEWFDIFHIDGQSLTPDVFGYYKKGDGYISAGSTQATDFKKGQWVPKAPKVIRSVINARGGFGVNGFYLPMNDDSNFGADFHCEPNSIIKLKGEDFNEYPQPRNGAPTTTDAYVSQLRSDSYAANLVLAVPGISTATGSNLITNGNFDSDISNWTAVDATVTWSSGKAQTNRTGGSGYTAYQAITVESGKRYTVSGTIDSTGTGNRQDLRVLDNLATSGGSILVNVSGTDNQVVQNSGSFTASGTTHYVYFVSDSGGTGFFDNVVVKQEDAPRDYSADIKGSGTNKTLTAVGNAGVGYEIPSYYGSAMTFPGTYNHNIALGANIDFAFGTGDFTVELWFNTNITARQRVLSSTQGGFTGSTWVLRLEPGNILTQYTANTITGSYAAPNQWHHVAVVREGAITSLFLNGVCCGVDTNDTKNYTEAGSNNFWLSSGYTVDTATENFDGEIQDLRVYKGVAKYKGSFDVPKPYTPVGIETWRQVPDNSKNNFATLSPLSYQTTGTYGTSYPVLSDGNLRFTHGQTGQWERSHASFGVGEGKWYFEFQKVAGAGLSGSYENWAVGVRESDGSLFYGETDGFEDLGDHVYWLDAGTAKIVSNQDRSAGATSGISDVVNGDIINIAFEKTATALKVWFGKNGTYFNSGNPATGANPAVNHATTTEYIIPAVAFYQYSGQPEPVGMLNFGQNPSFSGALTAGTNADDSGKGLFKYAPPTGYLALCEDNLPTPAIADPGKHFKTVLYRGDGNNGHSITGVGFQPDLVWLKERTSTSSHQWHDSVRGAGNVLFSNATNAESYSATYLYSLDSDGFTLGTSGGVNASTDNYVAWCWKAGGAAVSNTDGTITSQVSANQTAGFSIVSYTGNGSSGTVGHGLGKTPNIVLVKNRIDTSNWSFNGNIGGLVYGTNKMVLQGTGAIVSDTNEVTSTNATTFTIGNSGATNGSSDAHIAYCWTEIEGFSKFGSYVGNANADGPFVYCGFKPALIIWKNASANGNWVMSDSSRDSVNPAFGYQVAESSAIEERGTAIFDFLSNGFKIRNSWTSFNGSGNTIIFMAFAESPFKTANAK